MLLADLADTSERVRETSSRTGKLELLSARMRELQPDEAAVAVGFLAGEPRQRQLGAGWATLRDLPPPAERPGLTVLDVDAAFAAMADAAGPGSQALRRERLREVAMIP